MTVQPPGEQNRPRHYGYGDYEEQPPLYAAPIAEATRRPVRRKRNRGTVWFVVIVVLIGLLVAADRVAAVVVENRLASKIQQSQHLSQKPSVSIDGFPFLTQVVTRNFGHATVDISDFSAQGVPISHIHADLRGVHVNSSYNSATVDTLAGTATLEYSAMSQVLSNDVSNIGHVTLSRGSGNEVTATYSILGVNFTADIAVTVLNGDTLEFRTTKVNTPLSRLGGNAPGFDVKSSLKGLPFGMRLTTVQVTSTGVDISATGTNVPLTGSSVGNLG